MKASPVDILPSYERGRGGDSRGVGEERLTEHTWLESIGRGAVRAGGEAGRVGAEAGRVAWGGGESGAGRRGRVARGV